MYSVLIQSKKTLDSFEQFTPIFTDAVSQSKIGICQWMEAGKTVETALPELINLVAGKEEWRAVIVRLEDDAPMAAFPAAPDNPYDFLINAQPADGVQESPVPLVRLTQMLGGVPAPQVRFERQLVEQTGKPKQVVYLPSVDPEDEERYRELSERYHLNAKPPAEILLLSVRMLEEDQKPEVRRAFVQPLETRSSEFWKRNAYPGRCRFACFGMRRQGVMERNEDLFRFWTCVMLLSTNDLDAGTLQAYRLHRVGLEFDRAEMLDVFQRTVTRVLSAQHYIRESIQREIEQRVKLDSQLPDFRIDTPVVIHRGDRTDYVIPTDGFGLTTPAPSSDLEQWNNLREQTERGLDEVTVAAERTLDQTASKVREICGYEEEDVLPLNEYQMEDMQTALQNLYGRIFRIRTELPSGRSENRKALTKRSSAVRELLLRRVSSRAALLGYLLAAALFLLSCVPAALLCLRHQRGALWLVPVGAGIGLLLLLLGQLIVLASRRSELHNAIDDYNSVVCAVLSNISENSTLFSKYLGSIATYMRGSSYLTVLHRKNYLEGKAQHHKQYHIKALSSYLVKLKLWSVAFHLPVRYDSVESDDTIIFNTDLAPNHNPLYTFEDVGSYSVPINTSGETAESPFRFVSRLTIRREELYDDAG